MKDGQQIILGYIPVPDESPLYSKYFSLVYPNLPRHMAFSHSCPLPQALMQELYTTTSGCNCASYLLGCRIMHPWKLMWNHVEPSNATCKMFCLFLKWPSTSVRLYSKAQVVLQQVTSNLTPIHINVATSLRISLRDSSKKTPWHPHFWMVKSWCPDGSCPQTHPVAAPSGSSWSCPKKSRACSHLGFPTVSCLACVIQFSCTSPWLLNWTWKTKHM